MSNFITYLEFRGDSGFKTSHFNEVDAMILSQLTSLPVFKMLAPPATLSEYASFYKENEFAERKLSSATANEKLLFLAGESVRFRDIVVEDFVTDISVDESKTFYGITYRISRFKLFVAYRGTDGSLVSWKENFQTLYKFPTPGQTQAKQYLEKALARPFVKVVVAGHSKGGNLAVYAATFAHEKYKKRIDTVYSFDGPGYVVDITKYPGYETIKDKIVGFIPEECVVGKLMNPPYMQYVIKSDNKGVYQHAMPSWKVKGSSFEIAKSTNALSKDLSDKLNNWISKLPREEVERLVDELFSVFVKNNILDINDLLNMDFKTLVGIVRSATRLSPENREFLVIIFKEIRSSK